MLTWIARVVLLVAGVIAAWFVAEDAVNFSIVQMTIALLITVFVLIVAAFWWPRRRSKTTNSSGQKAP